MDFYPANLSCRPAIISKSQIDPSPGSLVYNVETWSDAFFREVSLSNFQTAYYNQVYL